MAFKKEKFKGLVHYICWKCTDPSRLGAIKLNKMLWFADVMAFAALGESITGAQYVKRRLGSVPKPILPILSELVQENAIRIDDVQYYGHAKKQYVALRDPDLAIFSGQQIEIIDVVIKSIADRHTAMSISDLTHDDVWKLAQDAEPIPLHAVFASRLGTVRDSDVVWALSRLGIANAAD